MWHLAYDPGEQRLTLSMREQVFGRDMRELAKAHVRALEATGGMPFKMLLDLRGLHPLDPEASEMLGDMKRVAARLEGYRGRAVLVDSATVAMQQRNTTIEDGGDDRELITLDEVKAQQFLLER